ncbi:UNKNOWN [Stylonychia lemnae]|uniref:Uncharacterized protein n=1 Tax=Stylonychia lemnae TaxID=5949 RepID=A0A078AAI6_STYLE|nr:UNKNOWN [Stylonychia lemnae]|eukprot:CDW77808.1 UNKNOWN [Stylonychia lemnae]
MLYQTGVNQQQEGKVQPQNLNKHIAKVLQKTQNVDSSEYQVYAPQNIYVQYQYNNFIYNNGSQSNLNHSKTMNYKQSASIISDTPITDALYIQLESKRVSDPNHSRNSGSYNIKSDLLTKKSVDLKSSNMIQNDLQSNNNKIQFRQSIVMNDRITEAKNLSEKVSSFNKHKLVVKQKVALNDNNNGTQMSYAANNLQNMTQDSLNQQSKNSARRGSLERTFGGFIYSISKQKAIDGAFKFFEKVQDKVKKLMPNSPSEKKINSGLYQSNNEGRKSIDYKAGADDYHSGSSAPTLRYEDKSNFSSNFQTSRQQQQALELLRTPNRNTSTASYLKSNISSIDRSSAHKQQSISKIRSIKPSEKEADDPIEPPSPRAVETVCVKCQRVIRQDKYVQDLVSSSPNTRQEMDATIIQQYAQKFRDEILKSKAQNQFTQQDYLQCKQIIQNIQFQEDEEKYKIKQEEMNKTIQEKEFLQKRTNDLIMAMQNKFVKKGGQIQNYPNIVHKGLFIMSDIRSDIDNQTLISDNSMKTQTSQFTQNSMPFSTMSNIIKDFQQKPSHPQFIRSMSNPKIGDEIDETVKFEESKREKEYFYEMCFKIKNTMFPENHLAKYANIPALFEESQKKNVSTSNYQEFIYNELSKNAQLWVSMKEINQIRRKTSNSSSSPRGSISSANGAGNTSQRPASASNQSKQKAKSYQILDSTRRNTTAKSQNSSSNRLGSGAKIVKIETIMEEDDAQLQLYND